MACDNASLTIYGAIYNIRASTILVTMCDFGYSGRMNDALRERGGFDLGFKLNNYCIKACFEYIIPIDCFFDMSTKAL